jgi:hypothetical protein
MKPVGPRPTKATLHWNDEAGEVDIVFEGAEGREARWETRDVHIRYDPHTQEILSVIVPDLDIPFNWGPPVAP